MSFRGTHRPMPVVVVYSAAAGTVDLSPFVVSVDTNKGIGPEPGTWNVTLKLQGVVGVADGGAAAAEAFEAIEDDDWILISVDDGDFTEHLMLGLIDSLVAEQLAGGSGVTVRTWRLQGRDFGKVLAETDLGPLPLDNTAHLASTVAYLDLVDTLSRQGPLNPGIAVDAIVAFALRVGRFRGPQPHWQLPPALPFGSAEARARPDRQAGDLFDRRWIDTGLEGDLSAVELLSGLPTQPGKALDLITAYTNDRFCEFFLDLRSPDRGPWHPSNPEAGDATPGVTTVQSYRTSYPAVVLRERPFPVDPSTVAHRAPDRNPSQAWSRLITHEVSTADLVSGPLLGRGRERVNYWSVTCGPGIGFDRYSLQLATLRSSGGLSLFTAPAGDPDSIRRHGWLRMEVECRYVDGTADGITTSERWTHLLRDWYWANHRFLSGQVRLHRLYPEIRVGERIRIRYPDGRTLLAYIEGVSHGWRRTGSGATQTHTALNLTRGTMDTEQILPPRGSIRRGQLGDFDGGGLA